MEMSGGEVITIERAFDIDALSMFNCGVRDDWRGKGIGTMILSIAEQNAREAEYPFLTTAALINKRYDASGFYEKCGFVRNGNRVGNTIPMYKFLLEQ